MVWMNGVFKCFNFIINNGKWNEVGDSETTVDELPVKWYPPNIPCNECQGDYHTTGDAAELYDPFIFQRVLPNAIEGDGDHQMSKGQPVVSISEEGILL